MGKTSKTFIDRASGALNIGLGMGITMLFAVIIADKDSLTDSFNNPATKGITEALTVTLQNGETLTITRPREIRDFLDHLHSNEDIQGVTDRMRLEARLYEQTIGDPMPYLLMQRLTASESGFDTAALSGTGARGILQIVPSTQLELMHKYGDLLPEEFRPITDYVERYMENAEEWRKDKRNVNPIYRFRIKEGIDPDIVLQTIDDPVVSFILSREYIREITQQVQESLPGRQLSFVDVKAAYVFGARGCQDLLKAFDDPDKQNHRAADYASSRAVNSNPNLFYADPKTREQPRSVEWLYNHFVQKMGEDYLPEHMTQAEMEIPVPSPAPRNEIG